MTSTEAPLSATERTLLLALTLPNPPESPPKRPRDIEWPRLMSHAIRHRVAGAVLAGIALGEWWPHVPASVIAGLTSARHARTLHTSALLAEVCDIADALQSAAVEFAVLRGPIMSGLYRPASARSFVDVDLVVTPGDVPVLREVLASRGWSQGNVGDNNSSIVPMTAADRSREPHQKTLHAFLKSPGPGRRPLVLEPHLNLFAPYQEYSLSAGEMLADQSRYLSDLVGIPTLSAELFLAELCIHIHSHGRSLHAVRASNDLLLYRVLDVAIFLQVAAPLINWQKFERQAAERGLTVPIEYGLDLARSVYGAAAPRVTTLSEDDLHSLWYFDASGAYRPLLQLHASPEDRLFDRSFVSDVIAWERTAEIDDTQVRDPHQWQ